MSDILFNINKNWDERLLWLIPLLSIYVFIGVGLKLHCNRSHAGTLPKPSVIYGIYTFFSAFFCVALLQEGITMATGLAFYDQYGSKYVLLLIIYIIAVAFYSYSLYCLLTRKKYAVSVTVICLAFLPFFSAYFPTLFVETFYKLDTIRVLFPDYDAFRMFINKAAWSVLWILYFLLSSIRAKSY